MENEQKAFKLTPQEFISLYQSNPKPLTNEEKIQDLLNEPYWESKPYLIGMDKIGVEDVMERFAEWKDEQQWKPTEKQLDALLDYVNYSPKEIFMELNSLYEELVKLYYNKR